MLGVERKDESSLKIPSDRIISFMPIYEFHCGKCGRDSEILVRSSDWKNSECPHCGSKKLAKKFSTFAAASSGENSSVKKSTGHSCGGGCGCH